MLKVNVSTTATYHHGSRLEYNDNPSERNCKVKVLYNEGRFKVFGQGRGWYRVHTQNRNMTFATKAVRRKERVLSGQSRMSAIRK